MIKQTLANAKEKEAAMESQEAAFSQREQALHAEISRITDEKNNATATTAELYTVLQDVEDKIK
jgi:hypothetical protein